VDGVLGGFGHVTGVDLKESQEFLIKLTEKGHLKLSEKDTRAVDCGAGIGRISEGLLCKMFGTVDLVEPVVKLLDKAKEIVPASSAGDFHYVGLQDFTPESGRYDVIWVQWVIGHLTDDDFCAFFQRCRRGLKEGGVIVLKENVCKDGFVVDKDDSSVTRSDVYLQVRSGMPATAQIIN
jgi:protein N-terminal methyltransferase